MKHLIVPVVALVLTGGTVLFAEEKAPATQPTAEFANKYCPIETENKIDPNGVSTMYEGKKIGFCCDHCIDQFNKDPQKYVAKMK